MRYFNFPISIISFLFLISLFSCKPKEQGLDSKVMSFLDSSFSSKYSYSYNKIKFDTVGNGDWSRNLAELMIDNPQFFSDKLLLDELLTNYQHTNVNDSKTRLIASVYYQNQYNNDGIFYIGIIGDSLTNVENTSIEALLNICSVEEAKVLDIANVINLTDRKKSVDINNTIIEALKSLSKNYYRLKDDCNKLTLSKEKTILNDKEDEGRVKDTIVHLQFLGNGLNDGIDSIMIKYPKYSIVKDYSFDNYSCYHIKDQIEICNNKYLMETQLYTIDNRVVLITAVCLDNIFDELLEMFKIKYGEYNTYAYSIDNTFISTVPGAHQYVWSFSNNCIILIDNNERHDEYYPDVTYQKPKILHTYYHFKNATIAYCDKQMYRILLQKENERKSFIEREHFISDSLERVGKFRKDSIRKAQEQERLGFYSSQI